MEKNFDAIVVGSGHAGVESSLALARTGKKTLLLTLSLDSISFMACNPSIGGTAKGHLVREIDALGGQMGLSADAAALQLKTLNTGKGPAVHSLRGQEDKALYHRIMKRELERCQNLTIIQSEAVEVLTRNNCVCGIKTSLNSSFFAPVVILTTGVYLNSRIIIGEYTKDCGPNGFENAKSLTSNLIDLGLPVRRFKTGTPARVKKSSLDFSVMEIQYGDDIIYPFSFMHYCTEGKGIPCYLTYTNQKTHEIILANLKRSPLFNGTISGTGPRYCPSIEDKVVRFSDKERHQIFIEPEGMDTDEMYVQGMSSSLPFDVQEEMYRTVKGMENVQIMRYAYAIEYDCLDPLCLKPSLETKKIKGLFCAGQINGSSGYEEAAGQGLIAGINASLYLSGKEPLIIGRDEGYIGVLIDDLVTKGTNEPYRMMTARAEYRLHLRQENADIRLTEKGRDAGLVSDERYSAFLKRKEEIEKCFSLLEKRVPQSDCKSFLEECNESVPICGATYSEILKRKGVTAAKLKSHFKLFSDISLRTMLYAESEIKYSGYLIKQKAQIKETLMLDKKKIPENFDYESIKGLRIEARQKLCAVRPETVGQASRISGVSPADINVLLVCLKEDKNKK